LIHKAAFRHPVSYLLPDSTLARSQKKAAGHCARQPSPKQAKINS
jgi:hypothetical protein